MPQPDSLSELGEDFATRFGELLKIAATNPKPKEPALVPAAGERSLLTCEGFVGGKDVEIVLVRAKHDADGKPLAVKETLTYRKNVAGTDLVYDLTGEFMQGKARPFDCNLREQPARLYALLPFQVEGLLVVVKQQQDAIAIEVEFQNALGKRVEGSLPCHAQLRTPGGKVAWERYLATSPEGKLTATAALPPKSPHGKWSLIVRSLADGKEVTLPHEVGPKQGNSCCCPSRILLAGNSRRCESLLKQGGNNRRNPSHFWPISHAFPHLHEQPSSCSLRLAIPIAPPALTAATGR